MTKPIDTRRQPTSSWNLKPLGVYPAVYVKEAKTPPGEPRAIVIDIFEEPGTIGTGITLTRNYARLLARRINQCLEDTR